MQSIESKDEIFTILNHFFEIVGKTISKIDLFSDYIIWEYIREALPLSIEQQKYLRLINSSLDIDIMPIEVESLDKTHLKNKLERFGNNDSDIWNISIQNNDIESSTQYGFITLYVKENILNDGFNSDEKRFLNFFGRQMNIAWVKAMNAIVRIMQDRIDSFSLNSDSFINKVADLISRNFSCDLCFLFAHQAIDNEPEKLKLIGQNSTDLHIEYCLKNDSHLLTSQSFNTGQDIRVGGNEKVRNLANEERLKIIEDSFNLKSKDSNSIVNQWLSLVISISKEKKGVIKLFRFLSDDTHNRTNRKPFSDFENNLLKRIQKHTYNLIAHKEIRDTKHTLEKEKEVEKEIERTENMRIVSHQVISPLSALMQHCYNLQKNIYREDEIPEKIVHINILAKQSVIYARSYMTLIELEKGTQKIEKKEVENLDKYLRPIIVDYQPILRKKGLQIFLQVSSIYKDLSIQIDRGLFKHAFFNLIDNAAKYSFNVRNRKLRGFKAHPKSKTDVENILVQVEELNHLIVIHVSNLGIKITKDEREKIFERDFRGKMAEESVKNGSGIGLYLAKRIINLHGGGISLVEGQNEFNTIFKITLPKI